MKLRLAEQVANANPVKIEWEDGKCYGYVYGRGEAQRVVDFINQTRDFEDANHLSLALTEAA